MNKKGFAQDIIIVGVLLFALGIGYFAFHNVFNEVVDELYNNSVINESNATREVLLATKTTSDRMDYIIFAIFIGLVLGIFITGWVIGGHPVFMFVYFLFIIIGVILAVVLSNTWDTFSDQAGFSIAKETSFPITNHLLEYLPFYIAGIGLLGLVAMFMKPFLGEG